MFYWDISHTKANYCRTHLFGVWCLIVWSSFLEIYWTHAYMFFYMSAGTNPKCLKKFRQTTEIMTINFIIIIMILPFAYGKRIVHRWLVPFAIKRKRNLFAPPVTIPHQHKSSINNLGENSTKTLFFPMAYLILFDGTLMCQSIKFGNHQFILYRACLYCCSRKCFCAVALAWHHFTAWQMKGIPILTSATLTWRLIAKRPTE